MADVVAKNLERVLGSVFLSMINTTVLLVLVCLGVGIWGALQVEQIAERILVRTEQTVASTLEPQTDRLIDGLLQVEQQIKQVGDNVQKLTVAIDNTPSITLSAAIAEESKRLVRATRKLTNAVEKLSPADFHLSEETWQHIANTAGEIVTNAIACQPRNVAKTETGG